MEITGECEFVVGIRPLNEYNTFLCIVVRLCIAGKQALDYCLEPATRGRDNSI